ncbi:MAG: rod shape-determining protein MreD [Candidatus Omnitrophica bacterium]|nr:rod shape-determining protein MreD [Candidatus Omnitrophota bacterium]
MYRIGKARAYALIAAGVLVESALLGIGTAKLDFVLIIIIFISLHSDWRDSLEAGLFGGLLRGILTTGSVGLSMAVFGLSALLATYLKNKIYKESFLAQILLTLSLSLTTGSLSIFFKVVMRGAEPVGIPSWHVSLLTLLLAASYTSILAPPAFFCLNKILKIREPKF